MTATEATYAAIANPVRRQILDLLREEGTLKAGEIADHFTGHSRPGISRHLRVLREAQLIHPVESDDRREQPYSLSPTPLREVQQWLQPYEDFWRQKLVELKDLLEEEDSAAG